MLNKKRRGEPVSEILIYVLCLGLCISTVIFVNTRRHIPSFEQHSLPIAERYYETENLDDFDLCTMGVIIYDENGICIDSRLPVNFDSTYDADEVFGFAARTVISKVSQNKSVARMRILRSEHAFFTIYGCMMYKNGQPAGTLFLVRFLPDLYGTVVGMIVCITAIYLSLTLCKVYVSHKKQKYFKMENDYIANITHDLKSPVASIKALSENLSLGVVEDEEVKKRYYALLAKESFNLQHTIQGILELSAIQNNQANLSKHQLKLIDCFEPIIEKYRILCDDMMIQFEVSDAFNTLPTVYTNPKNATRLLDILLNNAIKFVGEEGIVRLEPFVDTKIVTICVRDNGIGIRKEDQKRIFDRFFMVDSTYNVKGSGLGLAIASEIVGALHEKIWVESSLGKGAAFYFTVHTK